MVLHDLLGGELLRGEVLAGGQHEDYHWWNWLASGGRSTRPGSSSARSRWSAPGLLSRTPASTWRRLREEYELLRGRVLRDLGISETNLPGPAPARCGPATPVS